MLIPWCWKDAPKGEKLLYAISRDSTAADPILDPWDVEHDLPLSVDALPRGPITNMLEEPALDVLPISSHYNPPE